MTTTNAPAQASDNPELAGRTAHCSYHGGSMPRDPFRNGCSTCKTAQREKGTSVCRCSQPSAYGLAIFEFRGAGSDHATKKCVCGFYEVAHGPSWVVSLWVEFTNPDMSGQTWTREVRALTAADAATEAQRVADELARPASHASVAVQGLVRNQHAHRLMKCRTFRPVGPAEFDAYYCGCHGWD